MPAQTVPSRTIAEEFAQRISEEERRAVLMRWTPVIILCVLALFFSIACRGSFPTLSNLVSILNQLAMPLTIALGLTFINLIGSIDLSVEGVVGLVGSLASILILTAARRSTSAFSGC